MTAIKVKICGVTRPEDAEHIAKAGADFIGINFWPQSKRCVSPEQGAAIAIAARAAAAIQIVGVFVNASLEEIAAVRAQVKLDAIQLHGDEDPGFANELAGTSEIPVWKAIPATATASDVIESYHELAVEVIMLDTPSDGRGGSGAAFDWKLARAAVEAHPERRIVVAGGLDPSNVAAAIADATPWGVDVASGVESQPGIKDAAKVTAFIAAARSTGS